MRRADASVAGCRPANGINANQLRRWMRERGIEPPELSCLPLRVAASEPMGGFVPVQLSPSVDPPIRVELRKGTAVVTVTGPRPRRPPAVPGCASGSGDPGRGPVALRCPLDMRAGMDTLLAQVVQVFGEARPHHAWPLRQPARHPDEGADPRRSGNLARLPAAPPGRFRWADGTGALTLSQAQFDALVLGLPWQQRG